MSEDLSCTGTKNNLDEEHGRVDTGASNALVSIPSQGVVSHTPDRVSSWNTTVDGDENAVKLDALGPIVLNVDGTMGRITNWANFTETEKAQAIRLISARNKKRKETLQSTEGPVASDET
jgi:hypothetical protein